MLFRAAPAPFNTQRKLAWSLFPFLLLAICTSLTAYLIFLVDTVDNGELFAPIRLKSWIAGWLILVVAAAAAWMLRGKWQRQSVDTVRRSEERLRISQRIAHIGSWDWDLASGRLDCSEEICRIFAIPSAEAPGSYQGYLALLPPEEREALAGAIGEAVAGASGYAVEHRVLRPDGSERFVSEVGEVFRDRSGSALRVVSVVHDVTERKEAEGALFFEKRYRALIENLPQRIFLKDCNSVYLSCNSSFARELGLESGEVFGKTDHDLFAAQLARKRLEDDARVMAAGSPEERDEQRERDGRWVSKALVPLKDEAGRVYGLLGILTDITSRKRAEEQLKESEERFRNTFEQAAVGICHVALGGGLLRINRRFCDILGYPQEELLGRTLDETIHPADLAAEREQVGRLLRREIDNYSLELRQLRKDGSQVWVNLNKSLVCVRQGEPKYLACVIEDVTAKREARDLRRERDLVQAASRAKSQFLANMSHEIRTPMNAVMGLGRLALKTELSAKQRGYLEKICSASRTLLDIINDVLDFSKIEAGRVELEKTEFGLQEVLASISDMLGMKAQEKGIGYLVRLDPELPKKLLGDPLRLTQVLNNLIGNAVKFTEKGEVVVAVKLLALGGEQVALRFSVQDTGIGLSPEQMERIFTPFTQADSSTTRRYGGSGLGLSISSQLVELMGGELRVESIEGAGSSFCFTVSFGIPAAGKLQGAPREEPLRSLRLLVLDGDPASGTRVAEILRGMPIVQVSVSTVPALLAALSEGSFPERPCFDLVLMDGATAGAAGIEEVCRSIVSRGWQLPTLVTVAPDQLEKVRRQAEELGLTGVLATPVRDSLLLDGIVRALSCGSKPHPGGKRLRACHTGSAAADAQAAADGSPEWPESASPASGGLEPARLAAETAKLERLLSRNSLDAKRQFARFRQGLPQGAFLEELEALELCMEKLDFKKARHLLARFPGRMEEQSPQETEREREYL
ncbi:MAG: hybrid sensor histidine kinase/response regulator [Geobacteraceae bacterium GWC2_58_44]|nr:MAG: hybrid sensor histidine kinase/response regulator [Geobacteraceae bacterium GWC2_58_44]